MLSFLRKFSKSPKTSSFEQSISKAFSKPQLDFEFRQNAKKRILNQITAEVEEVRSAELLDRKLANKRVKATGIIDSLAAIAEALLNLPRVSWRGRRQGEFKPRPSFRFSIFKQATAFAMLVVVVGGITAASLFTQTETAVAQLSVGLGVVKIRTAESNFFEDVQDMVTVRLGDTIRVDKNSSAELTFFDASEMQLTEGTEIAIIEFSPDYISREKSGVKVAVLSGSVETTVDKAYGSFEVETPSGSVEAQNAKFSVAVNSQTGSTKIETSEDMIAVKSSTSSESVPLVAGEAVVFADPASAQVLLSAESNPVSIDQIASDADFIKIRSFDALIAAQDGDVAIARKVRASTREKLDLLIAELGVPEVETDQLAALEIFVRKNYIVGPIRDSVLANLDRAAKVEQILNYYFVAPQFLKGVPEFEILADSRFTPSGKLRNLFAILRAQQLAHVEIRPIIDELIAELTIELAGSLRNGDLEKQLTDVIQRMDNQPIFLSVLEKLKALIPSENYALVDTEIEAMQQTVQEYVGA